MTLARFENHWPQLHPTAYVHPLAYVSGQTTLAAHASIWPMAVLRGDIHQIHVGEATNVQDGAVLHVTHPSAYSPGYALSIGAGVTIGHRAVLHACTVGNRCLIGMGSIVLDGAVLEDEVMVGAGSVVAPGKRLASGYLYLGSPARQIRPLTTQERDYFSYSANHYVELARRTATSET